MKINNLLLLLMAFLIFILSVSAINAQEIDNSNENLTVSDNSIDVKDDIISSDLSNDEEILGYHDNGQAFYIGFDQEDITVGEGESATITGDILTSSGQKWGYGDFALAVSVNNVNKKYVDIKNGHFSLSTDGLGLTTSGSPYTIKFTPVESMEYNVDFCEQYEGEVASSWVTVTVANVEPANVVYVDSSYTGSDSDGSKDKPYKKIADGVTNADEGKTVSIANGEYNGEGTITINKNIDIVGESASGVIVNNAIFKYNPTADITSILANLTINGATSATTAAIDIAKKAVALTVNNVNINNWVVEGSDSVIKSQSTSPVVFDNVNILNTKGTATSGTAASSVFLITASTGGATIKNSCINNTQFLGTTNSNGILKCVGSTVNMDNVTVFGTTGRTTGLFHLGSNSAVVDVKNSKILNNDIQGSASTTSAANGVMFYAGGGSSAKANMTVQNSIIKDNIIKNHLVYTSYGIVTLNYNVITNNTQARMSYSARSSDVFNADYNWWGSNTNPDASKINNVVVMETSATPSTVEYGKNVVIKADFTKFNESGTLSPLAKNIPDAVVVNFNDAVEKTIKDGVATYTVKVTKDNNVFSVTADEEKQSVSVKEKLPVSWDSIYLTENGVVSGSADIISVNPWTTSGSLQYTIPEDVKEIKSAIVVVNSYSGSGNSDNYALHSDVTLTTDTTKTLGSEDLDYSGSQTGDPTVYVINDHTSKQYSDYQYTYDILSDISSLSAGETLTINVANSKLGNKGFDGRIKMISLFIAYDDGDKDNITYFFDVGQVWSQSTSQITLNTAGYSGAVDNITFKTIALSSFVSENIKFNNMEASSPSSQYSNNYYIFITWDNISDYFVSGQNLAYSYSASGSGYGSYKTNLILLTATEKYEFVPNISIDSIKTPESNSIYAGINNTITVTINNKESESVDNITVELYSNESSELIANYTYDSLTSGSSSIALEDPTVRPITENTVLPDANNNKIEYTVNIKYNDNIIATTTASRKVVYNGYLNKTYAFEGHENIINRNYTISGDVIISTQDVSKYAAANSKSREETWNIETPEGAEVTNVFLYFPYNWDASYFPDGWTLTFNGNDISSNIINHERDKSNIGYRGDNVYYGLVVFDVTSYYLPNDNNTFNIQKTGECALYPSTLVVLYNVTGTKTIKDVYFSDVCDVFYPYYNKVGYDDAIKAFINYDDINIDNITNAVWYSFTGSSSSNVDLSFNNEIITNAFDGYSSNDCKAYEFDVTDIIGTNNEARYITKAQTSTAVAYEQILVVTRARDLPTAETTVKSEYTSVPSIYAGVNNTLTVTVKNSGKSASDVVVTLLIGDEVIGTQTLSDYESGETYTLTFVDTTIRPITENTVNGNDNENVVYTVSVEDSEGILLNETDSSFVVLYNGNLGKDFEYPNANPLLREYTITGDVIIGGGSQYAASSDNVNDIISVEFDGDVAEALLYVSYNWNNPSLGDFTSWNITFNDKVIAPIASYKDQGNLGNYGKYSYGLVVYNVTDLVVNGDNALSINRTAKNVAVYPASLIVLTNNDDSFVGKVVYILEEADLLSKSYNKNLDVGFSTAFDVVDGNATLYVFAASAEKNEGNLIINGENNTDVWKGTSKSVEMYSADVDAGHIDVYFESTGGTILALHQIVVVNYDLPTTAETSVKSEYTSVPSIYAGVNNTLTVTVKNSGKSASDVVVTLLIGDEVIGTQTLADYESGETYTLTFVDTTIRPITENTVNGNDNENVVYTVAVKDNGGNLINETSSSFVVLYNGNLGKDFEYPNANPLLREYTITGDVIIGGGSQYAASSDNVNDIISVEFDGDVAEALLYVSYNWNNPSLGDFTSWNITFNDKIIAPIASYKDQGNLGNYGKYSYGLVVYNVTDLVVNGNNALSINRTAKNVAVYPASLLVLTNKESSLVEKTVYIWEETDLLSKSYNKNLPAGFNTSFDVVDGNATLYVFAASAEKNEGNLIINGENNTDVWKGTSKSVEMYSADVDAGHIDVYFESTGATILALHQIVVVSNEVLPEIDVSAVKTPWSSGIYAGVENNLTVTINNKESIVLENVTIEIYSNETGDVIATQTIDSLAPGETTIVINDPTIRELTENTVWPGAQNNKIKYNINVKYADSDIINKSFDKIVAYNGYLNKTYAYDGSDNKINRNYTITGDVIVSPQPTDVYMDQFSRQRTETWNISVPDDSTLVKAFLYFNYNWDTSFFPEGWTLAFNGNDITEKYIFWDIDQGNLGGWGIYQYGSLVFDVSDYFVNGENTFNITKTGNCALYPSTLVVLYNTTASTTIKDVYFSDICDVLYGYYNQEYMNETNVYVPFNGINITDIQDASWYVFAGSADGKHDGNISFNDKVFTDLWDDGNSNSCYPYIANVTDIIGENNAAWYLTNPKLMSTLVVYEQILIVTRARELPGAETTVKTEYTNTVYAGVVNNLTLTVKNTGISADNVVVRVLIGDDEIGSETIAKYDAGETYTLNIIDSTIRPITENTVNGNNNEKINYTVVVESDDGVVLDESNYTFVVLYNGNLGKDFEYPNANSTLREFTVTGDVIVVTTEEYSSGSETNRTDVFDVALNDGVVSDALLYVSYNWDKIANGDFNTWITTFNGQTITPIASYRDQSNLGSYGKYGYGLVVYNVTGLVVDGQNTFVLNKTKGNAAIYPSTLIVLTDAENSSVEKTVYILEEVDLLSKTYNKNLGAGFNTTFDVIDGNATLYVFAASAQSGEGNLIINGETNSDVWDGSSNSVEAFIADVTSGNIKIYFESTGSTILALHQMVVVENIIPEVVKQNATIVIDAPEITEGENATITVTIENATGDVTISVGNITKTDSLDDGKVIFVIPDLIEGNYTIDVTYAGDDNFNNATANSTLTVNAKEEPVPSKENVTMDITADPITEGEDATVVVALPEDASGNVTVGNTTVPVVNGTASVPVSGLAVGNTTLPVVYSGDDKYNPAEDNVTVTVNPKEKVDSNINVSAEDILEGEAANVVVLLPGDATGNVTVILNGESKVININDTTVRGLNGALSMLITYNDLVADNYTVVAIYSGDENYNPSNATATFEVAKAPKENATMEVSAEPITEGEDATVVVTLPEDASGNVTVGDVTVPVVNGTASVPVSGLAVGNTTLPVVYSGDDKYNPAESNVTVTVNPKEPVPSKENATMDISSNTPTEGENTTVSVTLPKDATGNVTAVVDGKEYTAPVKDGKATLNIPGLSAGNYTVPVTYSGDDKYNPVTKDIEISVEKDKSDIISAPDVTKYYGGSERFVVNVTDSEGNPVANKSVTIVVNGQKYDRTTKDDGTTSIGLALNSGVYNATVTVDNKTINSVVTVLSTVNGTDVVKVFRNGTQYYATFRDSEGNYLKEGTTVTFNINGVMYERKISGSEGLAKLNLNLEQGTYVLTAMNPETGENAANNITVIARLIENKDITKYYRNATQYTVKVIGDDGKAVGAGENVVFNINGVMYTRATNASGIAKLNLNLQPGDYIITAEYKNCKVSNNIKVLPVLSARDISMRYRDGTKFVATLVDGQGKALAGEIIQFNINGVFYNRATDSSGQAKLNINLQAGQYIITSSYNGANIANTVTVTA